MIIAQISDPHITSAEVDPRRADAAAAGLQRAVQHIMELSPPPDLVLVTGDCANDGRQDEYGRVRDLLRPLAMPVFVIPGNHDHRERMRAAFGDQGAHALAGFVQYVVEGWPVRLIALDTHIPGRSEGELCADRLGWLAARLEEAPDQPTVIAMHHPPLQTGFAVLDSIGLTGSAELAALLVRHPQVERVVAGHLHMAVLRRFAGTLAMTCPATQHTLLPDFAQPERLTVLNEPPACLLHVWDADAGLITYTSLIGDHPTVELHDGTRWL
ncbi:MAG TPA: phosphodiesterase [Herpetosiphonaceae bacterium]|nr:phosphodiesterase [Herpetosiphonaceae bacterium]